MPLHPGRVLNNRYRIAQVLSEGGNSAVYQAWDQQMDSPCTVKEIFDTSGEFKQQFEHEAKLLQSLRHPNLTGVVDHFIIPDQGLYLVMDFVEGEDASAMLERVGGPLQEHQVVGWISQICDALTYLHTQQPQIIHGDIKPVNIKIGTRGRSVLVDYGINGSLTPGYSAPEQYEGKQDARSDIYSLAATTYTLLTNQVPSASVDITPGKVPSIRPVHEVNPKVSRLVSKAIHEAMRVHPEKRTSSASSFKAALTGAEDRVMDIRQELGDEGVLLESTGGEKATGTRRRMSATTLVGILLLLGALLVVGVLVATLYLNNYQANQKLIQMGTNTVLAQANIEAQQTSNAILVGEAAVRETERIGTATKRAELDELALTSTLSWLGTAQSGTATQAPLMTQAAEKTSDAQATLDWQATSTISSQATSFAMEAHYQLALRYIDQGYWQEAWFELRDVIAGDPDYKDVQTLLAQVEVQLDQDVEIDTTLKYLWRKRNPLLSPSPRRSYAMAYDTQRGAGVIFGGYNGSTLLGDTWLWSGDIWSQFKSNVAPPARDAAVMVYDQNHSMLVLFGGRGAEGTLGDTWLFDDNQWTLLAAPEGQEVISPQPRVEACATYDRARNEVVLFGGTGPDGFFTETWTFDGENWSMHEAQVDGPDARVGCAMAYDQQRRVVVLFGGNNNGTLDDTWEWDGSYWERLSTQTSPPARAYHAMAYHPSLNRVLLIGGNAGGCSLYKDTWGWDGERWVELDVGFPGTRGYVNADYDSRRNAVIVFGGLSTDLGACQDSQETWELLLR